MKLYHITPVENLESILKNGLIGDEYNNIYLFREEKIRINNITNNVRDCIASGQLGLDEYVLLHIHKRGIKSPILHDMVSEITSPFQYYIEQSLIDPKYISFKGIYKSKFKFWF